MLDNRQSTMTTGHGKLAVMDCSVFNRHILLVSLLVSPLVFLLVSSSVIDQWSQEQFQKTFDLNKERRFNKHFYESCPPAEIHYRSQDLPIDQLTRAARFTFAT